MSRERQAAENRASMPQTASTVDAFRAKFGKAVRVIWAEEGVRMVGVRQPAPRTMNANEWLHYVATGEQP